MRVFSFFGDFGFVRASEIFARSSMVAIFMIVVSGLSCGSSFVFAMISLYCRLCFCFHDD